MVRALKKTPHGIGIAEAVLGAALLALVLIATLNIFPSALALVGRARSESQARNIAQSLLEESSSRPFHTLATGRSPQQAPTGFEAHLEVSEVDGIAPERLKRVAAEVTFSTRNGPRKVREEVYVHSVRR